MLPDNIIGLTDEQIEELKLRDEWADKCVPSGGWTFNKDLIGMTKNHSSVGLTFFFSIRYQLFLTECFGVEKKVDAMVTSQVRGCNKYWKKLLGTLAP